MIPGDGRIHSQRHVEYDKWAECCTCDRQTDNLPTIGGTAELKQRGWRRTRKGWQCGYCVVEGGEK